MVALRFYPNLTMNFLYAIGLCIGLFLLVGSGSVAAVSQLPTSIRRNISLQEWNLALPAGLAYASQLGHFFLVDKMAGTQSTTIVTITPHDDLVNRTLLDFAIGEAAPLVFDEQGRRLLLLNEEATMLAQVRLDEQNRLNPATLQVTSIAHLALGNGQGMAVDTVGQRLFILDGSTQRIVSVALNATLDFPLETVTVVDLAGLGGGELRGLALHPATRHLFVASPAQQLLYELTQSGELVNQYAIETVPMDDLQAFVFAPSADLTDGPDTLHLFVVERGRPAEQKSDSGVEAVNAAAPSTPNQITEIVLDWSPDEVTAAALVPVGLTLIQQVNTSAFAPPSPDPSGVVFIAALNRLLISDSEVDEMPVLFTGAALFEATTAGVVVRSGSTAAYSREPTGVGFNPANGHLFITDDDQREIFEVASGADALVGTSDDLITSFDTASFYSLAPADVTYDSRAGVLWMVDSTNAEVYRINPGPNGRFDGVAATGGDDGVTNFDVQNLAIYNPKGIHYDSVSDHLFLVANNRTRLYEVTTAGVLVQLYDTSAAAITQNAGVTLAPSSTQPGVTNFYLVDSGIDNGVDPMENDGRLIELSRSANPPPTPVSTATPTPSSTGESILVGAGDIASCPSSGDEATANLLDSIGGTVFTVGDHVYIDETVNRFANCYESSWGRHKARTRPAAGNHEYHLPGATDYFAYFGTAAGDPQRGYYSYDLGAWHIIVLNSNCAEIGGCGVGSTQEQWLRADLAAHPTACTLAYWHSPRFSSSASHGSDSAMRHFWQALYEYGADVVLNGHDHTYERFARQNANGVAEPARGIREFIIGTGGAPLYAFGSPLDNSEVRRNDTHGVLKLSLRATSYTWEFIPVPGKSFNDSGSESCVQLPTSATATPSVSQTPTRTPTASHTPTRTPTSAPMPTSTPTLMPTATPTGQPALDNLLISPRDNGIVGGIAYRDEDILSYKISTGVWSLFFDGSDVGITTDIDAFAFLNDGSILLSFEVETTGTGLGPVDDSDIIRFMPTLLGGTTAGTFSWYVDGSDVGLTTDSEDIDAITLHNGKVVLSTLGDPWVASIVGGDEDLLTFTPTQLGATTTGTWALYLDGSDVGLNDSTDEDIQGTYIDPASNAIYLSTRASFSVTGVSGDGADIFICRPSSLGDSSTCTFAPFWDGSLHGLIPETIDAFSFAPPQPVTTAWSQLMTVGDTLDGGEEASQLEPTPDPTNELIDNEDAQRIFLPLVQR